MRSRSFLLTILFAMFAFTQCMAQSWVDDARNLLGDPTTIAEARTEVEDHLRKDPNDVDALMMMGNVIYQEFNASGDPAATHGLLELRSTDDESIYDQSMGFLGDPIVILPRAVADSIVGQWLKAVKIDRSRADIHMGICYILSISLQTDKLIAYLPVLTDHMLVDDQTPYDLADYAHNLIDRGRPADGMRTYVRISELFPACTGILSDIGGTYYQQGDLVNAEVWMDRAMARSENDVMTDGNAFFIYAVLERNDKALNASVAACKLDSSSEDLLYRGILELAAGKDWTTTMKEYVERPNAADQGLVLANALLNGIPDSLSTYMAAANAGMNDGFMMPVHHLFRDRIGGFAPSFNYAEALGYNHRDRDAVVAFDAIQMDGLSQEDREQVLFHKAWSVQQVEGVEVALTVWQPLLTSNNLLYHSAAAYFIGKQKLANGQRDAANELFRSVADSGNKNKYAMMCAQLLQE